MLKSSLVVRISGSIGLFGLCYTFAYLQLGAIAVSLIAAIGFIAGTMVHQFIMDRSDDEANDQSTSKLDDMRSAGECIAKQSSEIAIGSANVSHFVDKLAKLFDIQAASTSEIADRVMTIETANQSISQLSQQTLVNISASFDDSSDSKQLLFQVSEQQSSLQSHIYTTNNLLLGLRDNAKDIAIILETINQLAAQTNMLALNAAIEAARAGEQGRGFAVVADEVRNLAKRTTDATQGIESVLDEITKGSNASVAAIDRVSSAGEQMKQQIAQASERVSKASQSSLLAKESMHQLSSQVTEAETVNTGISANVKDLFISTDSLKHELVDVSDKVLSLCHQTEDIFRSLTIFDLDNRNALVQRIAISTASAIGSLFDQAIDKNLIRESDLFDKSYQPIQDTNPLKHTTKFDSFTDNVLPAIQEPVLEHHDFIIYAGAVDLNGYFPTHNKRFSKALTGDYDKDLVDNRTKRIFDDQTGARCGSNTQLFLLQTYKRDTGEVMHDLSAPIYVKGKHWGGFRIGYQAQ